VSRRIKVVLGILGGLLVAGLVGLLVFYILFAPVSSSGAQAERHAFSLDIMSGNGAEVSWEGYTDEYRPGTSETMHLAVKNSTDKPWAGRLCFQLLEPQPSSVVMPLANQEFNLQWGDGLAQEVHLNLPADLSPGIYGLSLVIHTSTGPIAEVIPIWVGDEGKREPFQGEWPMGPALEACRAPQSTAYIIPALEQRFGISSACSKACR